MSYVIISGTNRPGSNSVKVAQQYKSLMTEEGIDVLLFSLDKLPVDFAFNDLYGKRSEVFSMLISKYLMPSYKIIFIVPEYNGGFPGVLKTFIDAVSPNLFHHKKAAMVGVSSGRAGSSRGMDHLTGILHYLKMEVLSRKPKLSGIEDLLNEHGLITDPEVVKDLREHIKLFNRF